MTYLVSIQRFLPAGYLFDCSTSNTFDLKIPCSRIFDPCYLAFFPC